MNRFFRKESAHVRQQPEHQKSRFVISGGGNIHTYRDSCPCVSRRRRIRAVIFLPCGGRRRCGVAVLQVRIYLRHSFRRCRFFSELVCAELAPCGACGILACSGRDNVCPCFEKTAVAIAGSRNISRVGLGAVSCRGDNSGMAENRLVRASADKKHLSGFF